MRTTTLIAAAILLGCTPARFAQAWDGAAYSGPYSVEIVGENGNLLPTFEHGGRTYVLGTLGQRYVMRVRNRSGQRIEVVASVDGRDVLDGQPGSWSKRGYIVGPYDDLTIDGFRLNQDAVAAFRFSSVPRSYAAQMGNARDVGVIGVAVFTERQHPRYWPSPPMRRDRMAPEPTVPPAPQGDVSGNFRSSGQEFAENKTEAPSTASRHAQKSPNRPGLGTEFAEEHASHVYTVEFERASATPNTVLSLRYDDRAGLLALGIDVDGRGWYSAHDQWLRDTAQPFRENTSYAQPPPGWRGSY